MAVDLTGGLSNELEFVFVVDPPDDPEMRESVNAWIWDDGADFGLPRISGSEQSPDHRAGHPRGPGQHGPGGWARAQRLRPGRSTTRAATTGAPRARGGAAEVRDGRTIRSSGLAATW